MKTTASLDDSNDTSVNPAPCKICEDVIEEKDDAIRCDTCCRWVCLRCIDDQKKGCCPKALYEEIIRLDEDVFMWECPCCANMCIPEQLINQSVLTKKRLLKLGVPADCFQFDSCSQEGRDATSDVAMTPCQDSVVPVNSEKLENSRMKQASQKLTTKDSEGSAAIGDGSEPMYQLFLKILDRQQEERREERENQQRFQQQLLATLVSNQQQNAKSTTAEPDTEKQSQSLRRLPKKELLTFDGDVLEWPAFWESFTLNVDSRKDLCDSMKLDYLQQTLKGAAKNKIKGLSLEGSHYKEALKILKSEYAKPDELREAQVKKLIHIFPVKESLSNLEEFIDVIRAASSSLQQMGVSNGIIDAYVVGLYEKLPRAVQMKIKEKRLEKGDSLENGTLEQLLQILDLIKKTQVVKTAETKFEEKKTSKWNVPPPTASFVNSFKNGRKPKFPCAFCEKDDHPTVDCKIVPDIQTRKATVEKKGRCGRCLRLHATAQCRNALDCFYCGNKGHHSAFCYKRSKAGCVDNKVSACVDNKMSSVNASNRLPLQQEVRNRASGSGTMHNEQKKTDEVQIHLAGPDEEDGVIMSTFQTKAINTNTEDFQEINAYLDTGAKCTCIDRETARKLNLVTKGEVMLETARFNSNTLDRIQAELVQFDLQGENGSRMKIHAYSIPNMTPALMMYPMKFDKATWRKIQQYQPKNIPPKKKCGMKIDVLIGMDYWYQIMGPRASTIINIDSNLFVHCSPMGNILAGNYSHAADSHLKPGHMMLNHIHNPDLSNLWKLEMIGIKETEEKACKKEEELLQYFQETTQLQNDRYYVRWPWRYNNPEIPSNFGIAKSRLKHTVNTLLRTSKASENLDEYNKILMGQLKNGIIEPVTSKQPDGEVVHYIPHFPHIKQDRATTKVRIVYDASAKTKPDGISLNDLLFTGKNYLEDLSGILIRFRLKKIAIAADIEKAFLQVGLQIQDRDCTRFLWLKNPENHNLENNIQVYRFTRVPFGIVSSPYLLGATIDHHLKLNPGPTSDQIRGNIYMDNIFFGVDTTAEGIQLYKECKELFHKASMNLREWESNDIELIKSIKEVDQAKGNNFKILGILWNTVQDTIQVKIKDDMEPKKETKRTLTQSVAQVFDPLGFVNPLVIKSKIKIQELWKEKVCWDSELPQNHKDDWVHLKKTIQDISKISLPRVIFSDINKKFVLLCFCDSSKQAYATVVYLYQDCETPTNCNLIFSKARVVPIKPQLTIPRLELLAMLIGTRALRFVEKQLQRPAKQKILWTDSQIALGWTNTAKPPDIYVKRRVEEIKSTNDIEFRYIPTKENPADIATRGATYETLVRSNWFKGPEWILNHVPPWTTVTFDREDAIIHQEMMVKDKQWLVNVVAEENEPIRYNKTPYGLKADSYASLTELLNDTVIHKKETEEFTGKTANHDPPSAIELKQARTQWLHAVQEEGLKDCLQDLHQGRLTQMCHQLDLFLDKEGLIRCGGRLANAKISRDAKFPILLPKDHSFTKLLVSDIHERTLHSGPRATLSEIRKRFWIPQGLHQTQKVLKHCEKCKRAEGKPFKQPKMGLIPAERLSRTRAFQFVGMDYCGPLTIRIPQSSARYEKRWLAIFTCFTTRAVHLELVKDSTAQAAINALTRFTARRGSPDILLSDNALQFKAAHDHVQNIWGKKLPADEYKELLSFFARKEISWQTIPEGSPWVGGFYERLIGLIKRTLRKVLWNATVDEDHLATLVMEIESTLNCRPLLALGTSPSDDQVLTPANFIAPTSQLGMPPADTANLKDAMNSNTKLSELLLNQWKKGQRMLDQFWKIWQNQYLQQLRECHRIFFKKKSGETQRLPQPGETVLVKSSTPRATWKCAIIQKLLPGADKKIRFVQIRLPTGTITRRSVTDLIPLEANATEANDSHLQYNLCQFYNNLHLPTTLHNNNNFRKPANDNTRYSGDYNNLVSHHKTEQEIQQDKKNMTLIEHQIRSHNYNLPIPARCIKNTEFQFI